VTRLAAEAARALGCGDAGLEAAERVIRAGLLRLGGVMLGDALAADRGHRGHRVPCGNGHEAVFCGYRGKSLDTVLGLVAVTRAWYHCEACGHGLAPRDADQIGAHPRARSDRRICPTGIALLADLFAAVPTAPFSDRAVIRPLRDPTAPSSDGAEFRPARAARHTRP